MLLEAFEAVFPNHTFDWRISGAGAVGFCPFHQDRHQKSLGIYLDAKGRERWYCFAEGIGGGLVELVMNSGLPNTHTRTEANYWLVQKGFLQETEQQVKDRNKNEAITKFYQWANKLLEEAPDAAGLRTYLASRHIDVRTISTAPIGYYPTIKEVENWLMDNNYYEQYADDFLPNRRSEPLAVGAIIFFYRSSYSEFTRLKLRNISRERNGEKCTMFLGKKLSKNDRLGYFSWNMEGAMNDVAILVEGEFDVGALSSLCFKADETARTPIYCFSGGTNLGSGVSVLLDMGKTDVYLFPDNDDRGIDYSYKIAEEHPQTFIIMPSDYKVGADPADWVADHNAADLNEVFNSRRPAFSWIGQMLANQAADATIEEQAALKIKLIEYAKKLPATDREMFLKSYGAIAGVSFEALLEEVEDKSQIKYRKVVSPTSNFGIQMKVEAKGYSEWEPISDVILEIERDLLIDDYGGDVERHILLRASTAYRSAMIEMKTDEFRDDKKLGIAITNALGSGIWIKNKCESYLREACILLSSKYRSGRTVEEHIYAHTGWRDEKFYSPTGYIDAEGFHELEDVKVELPANPAYMQNYHLDAPPSDLTFIKEIIRNEMLQVFPYEITLPFLAHVFWTPLAHFIPMAKPVCLWVVGLTGSFKTSYTGLMASFFGDFETGDFETWRSTTNAIEKNGYYLKDMIYVVDDYKGIDVNPKALTSCIQNYGDRHGRGRMGADLNARKTWYIRGNMIATAEDVPQGEASVISRIMLLKIPGRGDSAHLTVAQSYAKHLPGVMSKFIQFLAQKKIRRHEYDQLLAERRMKFNAAHGRVCESLAANSIAWDLVAEFLGLEDLTPKYYQGIDNILTTMNLTTKQEQAGYIFIETVADLLASRNFYLEGVSGCMSTEHSETAKRIGWITPKRVYLLGTQALAEVNRMRTQITGQGIKYTANTIYEQLIACGAVVPDGKGKATKVVKIERQSVRILEFRRGVLEQYDETPGNSFKPTSCVVRDSKECPGIEQ